MPGSPVRLAADAPYDDIASLMPLSCSYQE